MLRLAVVSIVGLYVVSTAVAAPPAAKQIQLPNQWAEYQWGTTGSKFKSELRRTSDRPGMAIRAVNIDPTAQAGRYAHVKLDPGIYEFTVYARTDPGEEGFARLYVGTSYSGRLKVGPQWRKLTFENIISKEIASAEINVQNSSGRANAVWFSTPVLRRIGTVDLTLRDDTRPASARPKTLMFAPINVNFLRETASDWARRGFRGFLMDDLMANWDSDVWAIGGGKREVGLNHPLLKELKACNDACRAAGIDSNFVKVALYKELPDPFDDAAWATITRNFSEGARFAKLGGCAGVAIDTEYISQQYNVGWEGYQKKKYRVADLKKKIQERWRTIVAGMLKEFPDMVLLTLPEGTIFYGELYTPLLGGMLQACADADAPGGLHMFTELTYHHTDPAALALAPKAIDTAIAESYEKRLVAYWQKRCSVALGAWPLGYYRQILDAAGKDLGWSGKKEVFGDKIVGSYADKSEWYTPEVFRTQMAGLNTFSPRYNWVYSHGAVYWHFTPEQIEHYRKGVHQSMSNAHLPVVPNLQQYFDAIVHPKVVTVTREAP